jgi:two-component system response regulator WspF
MAPAGESPGAPHLNAPPIVALGASTGGPKALATILGAFPDTFSAAVVIVQHLDAHFYQGLSEWLAHGSRLPVVAVDAPMTLEAGTVYLAARPEHVVMSPGDRLSFTREWPELVSRPSIDVLFRSLAEIRGARGVAALMTGMGRDGAEGLLALRRAGFYTIAQDAPSSVVYGMPRVAAEIGAATTVLPLDRIGARIVEKVEGLMGSEHDIGTNG